MQVINHTLDLRTESNRVSYLNITDDLKKIVKDSGVESGIIAVSSQHTTCSVIFEEFVHDYDWNGDEYLQVDLNRILDNLIPRQLTESDYLYPGPEHVQFMYKIGENNPDYPADLTTILNADAHIRSSLFGASETFPIVNKEIQIGTVGSIYFIDWDQNRERNRKCNVVIIGK